MHIDVAIDQLKGLISHLINYRENGFTSLLISTKKIAAEMGIESIFVKRRVFHTQKKKNS